MSFSQVDLVRPWNKPIIYLFAVLFIPFGVIFWCFSVLPVLFKNPKRFAKMNHWVIFTPGAQIGSVLSIVLVGPFASAARKVRLRNDEADFKSSEIYPVYLEAVKKLEEIYKEAGHYVEKTYGHKTRISIVDDKNDGQTRFHLIFDNNRGNIMFFIHRHKKTVSYKGKFQDLGKIDFEDVKTSIYREIDNNAIAK